MKAARGDHSFLRTLLAELTDVVPHTKLLTEKTRSQNASKYRERCELRPVQLLLQFEKTIASTWRETYLGSVPPKWINAGCSINHIVGRPPVIDGNGVAPSYVSAQAPIMEQRILHGCHLPGCHRLPTLVFISLYSPHPSAARLRVSRW